jgi:hypothetical protein
MVALKQFVASEENIKELHREVLSSVFDLGKLASRDDRDKKTEPQS